MRTVRLLLAAAAVACAPLSAGAQNGGDRHGAWRAEAAGMVARLEQIEAGLPEDPGLRRMAPALGAALIGQMLRADPALARDAERLPRLEAERTAARARDDTTALRRLDAEMAGMQGRWRRAQAAALAGGELGAKARVFNALLRERVRASSPAAGRPLDRLQIREERLAAGDPGPR
ncbi:MAG TPA: hypothetical protein VF142_12045 [Longimicrobium sp.]